MWTIQSIVPDPLGSYHHHHNGSHHHNKVSNHNHNNNKNRESLSSSSCIVRANIPIQTFLWGTAESNDPTATQQKELATIFENEPGARVALADFVARKFTQQQQPQPLDCYANATTPDNNNNTNGHHHNNTVLYSLEPLDWALTRNKQRRRGRRGNHNNNNNNNNSTSMSPYVLERTDVWCSESKLHVTVRMVAVGGSANNNKTALEWEAARTMLNKVITIDNIDGVLEHVACVVFQKRIRARVAEMKVVAFVADGSVLPRKSGTSHAPMASPPAIPFLAPPDSPMSREITIGMGDCPLLAKHLSFSSASSSSNKSSSSVITLRGLVIPAGVTLICGGGYHGKSTLLKALALGVYDKVPGDGREFCVAHNDAVSVRAEDGRYVHNCNVSAFISNLPTTTPVVAEQTSTATQHFSSRDASGSTSQAANVSEAIEAGCFAMLVDEDVSAANFMARDGRMRALVMDESITPLLYRVNGLYASRGVSSVVVVGGVGDWLDVPDQVVLLNRYVASDATQKARSISYQFSYGHVQYAGRGVVHRLDWKDDENDPNNNKKNGRITPLARRPTDSFTKRFANHNNNSNIVISLLDGGHALSLHPDNEDEDEETTTMMCDDDEEGFIDASRLEQLLGRKQLYGCGLCVAWILRNASKHPTLGLSGLLQKLDDLLDEHGWVSVIASLNNHNNNDTKTETTTTCWNHLVESVGYAQRPRRFEIGQTLTRMYGIEMEEAPVEDKDDAAAAAEAAKAEEEQKKKALAELWASRRSKKRF